VRRFADVEDLFGRVRTYSVSDYLDGSRRFGPISILSCFKLFTLYPYMTGRSAW
jgi:hypothetical protein